MKRQTLLVLSASFVGMVSAQSILVQEDFDAYNNGDLVAATIGLPWSTWAVAPGTSEDTPISNEQAASGANSMKVTGAAAGGPTDLILRLGNRTSGTYALSWNMYIPSGNGGYFNLQHNEVPGAGSWMAEATFLPSGTAEYTVNNVTTTGSYPHDTWFNVTLVFDLGTQQASLSIDDTVQTTWQTNVPGPNRLGGVDFFAYAGGAPNVPLFYVDDVLFMDLTTLDLPKLDPMSVSVRPNPAADVVTVEMPGSATNTAVALIDATGRILSQRRTMRQQGPVARMQLDVSALPEGLYFVRITARDSEIVKRIVKQ